MAEITVTADTGRPIGSRASGRLRGEGRVPGVVYGLGRDPQPVAVAWRELRHALTGDAGMNALIDLHVGDGNELVIVKELQRHPVRRDVLHVDFLRVSRDQELTVDVPIVLHGEAIEVLNADGSVDQQLHALTVQALPQSIPNELTLDISTLTVGHTLRVSDLVLPEGVTTTVDPDEPVVTTSTGAPLDVEPVEGEGEEVEGAEVEAGEGAAETGGDSSEAGDAE